MTPTRSLYCYDHQGKGREYVKALQNSGFSISGPRSASVVLLDYDIPARINPFKERFEEGKARLISYPHAATPNVGWDGLLPMSKYLNVVFVSGYGHIEILRRIGVTQPIIEAGWAYCTKRNFQPNPAPKRILFAPIHPTRRGYLAKVNADINLRTFQKLLSVRDHFEITVRHVQSMERNGLSYVEGIHYTDAETDLRTAATQVMENDVIVGHQTIAYISVASGKPTLMMGEKVPPRNGSCESDFKYVAHFDDYKDLLMYPLDILAEDDTMGLILRASKSDDDIRDWRDRMIGQPFNPKLVSDTVISYL